MSKHRYVDTKLWSDNWIVNLDPIEKLLFLYLITNEKTNICGIYELPTKTMAAETGIEKDMVEKVISRFSREKKVLFVNGWIIVLNFIKYQAINPKISKGIFNMITKEIPKEIKVEAERFMPWLTGWLEKIRTNKEDPSKAMIGYDRLSKPTNNRDIDISTSTKNSKTLKEDSTNDEKSLKDDITDIDISNEDKGAAPPPPKKETISYELTPKEEAGQFFDNLVGGGTNLWVEKYLEELVVKGAPRDQLRKEAIKFATYWTEKNNSGKKERWELQKTFEVGRRLATWLSRSNSSQNPFIKKNKTIIYE